MVYGPLESEFRKMRGQVEKLEFNPSREVGDRIRQQDRLEWMIEPKELRMKIGQLYDKGFEEYRETIHRSVQLVHRSLEDKLLQEAMSSVRFLKEPSLAPERAIVPAKAQDTFHNQVKNHVHDIVHGLAWPVLESQPPDEEDAAKRRVRYQELRSLAPNLKWCTFDEYFAEVTTMYDPERMEVRQAQKHLLAKIKEIHGELEKLLRPN